jgi:hypothetical protein
MPCRPRTSNRVALSCDSCVGALALGGCVQAVAQGFGFGAHGVTSAAIIRSASASSAAGVVPKRLSDGEQQPQAWQRRLRVAGASVPQRDGLMPHARASGYLAHRQSGAAARWRMVSPLLRRRSSLLSQHSLKGGGCARMARAARGNSSASSTSIDCS